MNRKLLLIFCALLILVSFTRHTEKIGNEKEHIRLIFLKQKVLAFASKYKDQDVIVVSKDDHLLYYCKNGEIVKDDQWNGFNYSFPVKVALASKYYWTPEGEMFIESKKPNSQYIRFLKFSHPGAYGIHSAETKYAVYLDQMEKNDPNFRFATLKDETRGCVQVENRIIKYLFAKIDLKTPVLVMP